MEQTALRPFRRKACWEFFSPWKIRRLRPGLNPRTWVPKASTLPLNHRSRFITRLTRVGVTILAVHMSAIFTSLRRTRDIFVVTPTGNQRFYSRQEQEFVTSPPLPEPAVFPCRKHVHSAKLSTTHLRRVSKLRTRSYIFTPSHVVSSSTVA